MANLFSQIADWAVKNRSKLPNWAAHLIESAARNPDGLVGQLSARLLGGGDGPVTEVPNAPCRVYIAPTNYAGQGFLWARALEHADKDLTARNMAFELPGGFAFAADTLVSIATVNASLPWAEAEWQAASRFTHVLVEAERSMFGKRFARDLEAEIAALESAGVSVAFICHGTDVRDPDRHAARTPWSLYPEDPRTDTLRIEARKNLALLSRLRRPTFVSTPDLLAEVPDSVWCPVIADLERFASDRNAFADEKVTIMHSASDPLAKGSHYIEPALAPLLAPGQVEYQLITGIPWAQMPRVIETADIVLSQFRDGSYGVAACEALAAGRVVVGHVLPDVRERIEEEAGLALPIVEATPDTLCDVIAELLEDREQAKRIAAAGPAYVAKVHSGRMSAGALLDHWIRVTAGAE